MIRKTSIQKRHLSRAWKERKNLRERGEVGNKGHPSLKLFSSWLCRSGEHWRISQAGKIDNNIGGSTGHYRRAVQQFQLSLKSKRSLVSTLGFERDMTTLLGSLTYFSNMGKSCRVSSRGQPLRHQPGKSWVSLCVFSTWAAFDTVSLSRAQSSSIRRAGQ